MSAGREVFPPGAGAPLPLALTMGEPSGIGAEITLKSWLARGAQSLPVFFSIDAPERLEAAAGAFGLAVPVEAISSPDAAAAVFERALPVLPIDLADIPEPGRPDPRNAPAVIASIERAVALTAGGEAAGIVTNPIQKSALLETGFAFPGHTEFLAALAARHYAIPEPRPVMMLAAPGLRVVPVTIHVPLKEVPNRLTTELIVETARITAADLKTRFGLARPRLAVAGLNPHAGEDGHLGTEDLSIIAPAIRALCDMNIAARGPLSADTLFHKEARVRYDAALCMYHDQALIPVKTLAFDRAVNVTLGLPFIRTSPDHGTAPDIAGKGTASPSGLIAAIKMAGDLAARKTAEPSHGG